MEGGGRFDTPNIYKSIKKTNNYIVVGFELKFYATLGFTLQKNYGCIFIVSVSMAVAVSI